MSKPDEKVATAPGTLSSDARWAMSLAALDHLDQGISVFDRELRLVGWNTHYLALLDFPPELGEIGRPFEDFIRYNARRGEYGPGDPEEQVRERVELANRFEPHCFERTRPGGTVLEIRGNRLPDGGFVTVYTDITERKRIESKLQESHNQLEARVAERTAELQSVNQQMTREIAERKRIATALWESESWMRLIMDAIPAQIAYVGTNRRYDFANKMHEELFDTAPDDIIGRRFGALLGIILGERLDQYVDTVLNGQEVNFEYQFTNAAKRTFYIRATFIPHFSVRGEVLGFFVLGQDITEYQKSQMALSQAQKMEAVGQLTGGLAHDFNNLLTIMVGNLDYLDDDPELADDARKAVQTALNATQRGADLTRRLLAFSRRQTLRPTEVDLARLFVGVRDFLQRTLGREIEVEMSMVTDVWSALGDPNELSNALLNLAINARDAMPGGGKLVIKAANAVFDEADVAGQGADLAPGEYVLLTVEDSGSGMTSEAIERAFEPFFTTKDPGAGTGLGLSMVYGFAKQSGGWVRIASRLGRGTTVSLYLPRAQAAMRTVEQARPKATVPPSRDKATILLVEDDPDVRSFTVRALTEAGFAVHEVEDGEAALAWLEADSAVDLLLSDIVMPGALNGWDLAKTVQRRYPEIKALCMSGYAEDARRESTRRHDPALLRKPFNRQQLWQAVHAALGRG